MALLKCPPASRHVTAGLGDRIWKKAADSDGNLKLARIGEGPLIQVGEIQELLERQHSDNAMPFEADGKPLMDDGLPFLVGDLALDEE
jgi:hypothetical protein